MFFKTSLKPKSIKAKKFDSSKLLSTTLGLFLYLYKFRCTENLTQYAERILVNRIPKHLQDERAASVNHNKFHTHRLGSTVDSAEFEQIHADLAVLPGWLVLCPSIQDLV